jgi:cell division protein FtsB
VRAAGTARPPGRRPDLAPRPKLTSRAAVLAVVLCAIALTLAYPVREYIADHRQIDQLAAQNAQIAAAVKRQRAELRALASPSRIEQEARDDLHMCFPSQTCYEVIYPPKAHANGGTPHPATPWYERLWKSVAAADATTSR